MNLHTYTSLSPFPGLKSGTCTSIGLTPHVLFLIALKILSAPLPPLAFLIMFTIFAKLLGEYFFWNGWKNRVEVSPCDYLFDVQNNTPVSPPRVIISIIAYLIDMGVEVVLIFWSSETSIAPLTVLLTLLLCQIVSSPLQGFFSDYYNRKNQLYFALGVTLIVLATMFEIISERFHGHSPFSLINLLCLDSFAKSTCILLLLCLKGLVGNISVIARALLAEAMQETLPKI